MIFQGLRTSIAKTPKVFFVFSGGVRGGWSRPHVPIWIRTWAHLSNYLAETQLQFTDSFKNELTTCFKIEISKIHAISFFICFHKRMDCTQFRIGLIICIRVMWIQVEGGGAGNPTPLRNHKSIRSLSSTGPDPLKTTKLPNRIQYWAINGLPAKQIEKKKKKKKKNVVKVGPLLTNGKLHLDFNTGAIFESDESLSSSGRYLHE